jgi:hypothetical protein
MPANHKRWLTAQQTALELNSTSAEICRLISIGRLSGSKEKQPGRPGKAQWLVSPASIRREILLRAKLRSTQKPRSKGAAARRKPKTVFNSVAERQELLSSTA